MGVGSSSHIDENARIIFFKGNDKFCTLEYNSASDLQLEHNVDCMEAVFRLRRARQLTSITVSRATSFIPQSLIGAVFMEIWHKEMAEVGKLPTLEVGKLVLDFDFPYERSPGGTALTNPRKLYQGAFTNSVVHLSAALNIRFTSVEAAWSHSSERVDANMQLYARNLQAELQKTG